jgi:hypothetical protein
VATLFFPLQPDIGRFMTVFRIPVLILLALLPALSLAQDPDQDTDAIATGPLEQDQTEKATLLETQKVIVESSANRAAQWVDSFFNDPNYETESASTLLRLRPEISYHKEQEFDTRLRARVKLQLPNLGRRTSLVIGNDDYLADEDEVDDTAEDAVVGLQFFGKARKNLHTSLSLGVKFNEFAGYVGPRFRYLIPWGDKRSVSLTQTIRYQTNGYWYTISRADFNFITGDRFLFRQTFDGRWRGEKSDEEGFRTRVSSILTQWLREDAGLQYEFTTIFHTRPDSHVDEYKLAVRYRKRTSRDWLYYEIAPEISFEDEFDYSFNPGIRFRLEFFYGADSTAGFRKREHEDTEDFRW